MHTHAHTHAQTCGELLDDGGVVRVGVQRCRHEVLVLDDAREIPGEVRVVDGEGRLVEGRVTQVLRLEHDRTVPGERHNGEIVQGPQMHVTPMPTSRRAHKFFWHWPMTARHSTLALMQRSV